MPKLDCSVINCRYNKDHGCVRDNINVGGDNAMTSRDTRCDSFEERRGDSYSNSLGQPSAHLGICCEAKECSYNEHCECHADKIDVVGSNACNCGGTACATFTTK